MKDNNKLVLSYDYYQLLLSLKQQQIFEAYYFNNFSLSELALEYNVSRNAIHKQLKAIEEKLLEYDNVLNLVYKGQIIEKVKSLVTDEKIISLLKEIE